MTGARIDEIVGSKAGAVCLAYGVWCLDLRGMSARPRGCPASS